jgi:hypothetical protein
MRGLFILVLMLLTARPALACDLGLEGRPDVSKAITRAPVPA